jgi:hypothetical protein
MSRTTIWKEHIQFYVCTSGHQALHVLWHGACYGSSTAGRKTRYDTDVSQTHGTFQMNST